MESLDNQNQSQSRFLIAMVLSMIVLFSWSYFYSPTKPKTDNTNTAANASANTESATAPQPAATVQAQSPQPASPTTTAVDNTPARQITIKSSLYEVTLDSKGGVATSWIIVRNKGPKGDFPVYADGSTAENPKPLQLISAEGLKRTPREAPFRLVTGNQ